MTQKRKQITDTYYACMQAGGARVEELIALFSQDAEYTEPFTPGGPVRHRGVEAIGKMLRGGMSSRPADFELELEAIDLSADFIVARWTCRAQAFGGAIKGRDEFEIENGKIKSLTTTLVKDEMIQVPDGSAV